MGAAYIAIPIVVVSALLTTVLILSDTCPTCCSCAKPKRVVREIKGLLSDSQPQTDQSMENIEMQQDVVMLSRINSPTEVAYELTESNTGTRGERGQSGRASNAGPKRSHASQLPDDCEQQEDNIGRVYINQMRQTTQ